MILHKLDFLGSKPELNISGNARSKTLLGGLLSIIVVVLLCLGTYYFVNILFSRKNFTIVSTSVFDEKMFMNLTNGEFVFRLGDRVAGVIPDGEKIFGFTGLFYYYDFKTLPDGKQTGEIKTKAFPLEKCNSSVHFEGSKLSEWKTFRVIDIDAYCLPRNLELYAKDKFGNFGFSQVAIHVHPCNNKTTNNKCYSRDRIDKTLSNALLVTGFRNFYYIHGNYEEPEKQYYENDVVAFSSSFFKKVRYSFQNVNYITDDGYFLPEDSVKQFSQIEKFRESSALYSADQSLIPGTFTELLISMGNFRLDYNRKYYKFQNMLADLGGILKGCISISLVINWLFSNRAFYNQIISKNFVNLNLSDEELLTSTQNKLQPDFITERKNSNNGEVELASPEVTHLEKKIVNKLSNLSELSPDTKSVNRELSKSVSSRRIVNYENNNTKIRKKSSFSFSCGEHFLPLFCFGKNSNSRKNLIMHFKLRQVINEQMDISNVLNKFCNIDKLNFLILGSQNKSIIDDCPDPYIICDKVNLSNKILNAEKVVMNRFKNNL